MVWADKRARWMAQVLARQKNLKKRFAEHRAAIAEKVPTPPSKPIPSRVKARLPEAPPKKRTFPIGSIWLCPKSE